NVRSQRAAHELCVRHTSETDNIHLMPNRARKFSVNESENAQLVSGFVNLRPKLPLRVPVSVAAGLGSFVILCLRSTQSIGRLPADPGYGYVSEALDRGVMALWSGDPYYHVAARAVALIVSWFPLASQAIVMTLIVHMVWSLCSVVIAVTTHRESSQIVVGVVTGLLLALAPHASESGIGNVGNIKWPMLAALVVVCASTKLRYQDLIWITPLAIITGLTQPLTVLALIPLMIQAVDTRRVTRTTATLALLVVGSIALQLQKVGLNAATTGQSTKVTRPWGGMGLFWWSGLTAPIIVAIAVALVWLWLRVRKARQSTFPLTLALMAIAIAVMSYRLGGIADRYFIVPMTLATIAALQLTMLLTRLLPRHKVFLLCALGIGVFVPTAKWFSTGWYLTSGPTWQAEIARARSTCETDNPEKVEVNISPSGTVELRCAVILND
ncbi:MAG: hypothetical protein EBT73_03975, partial [Actinobacteria bacterium]|nr:hypothetical protein [Actinomycetota bacterium]